MKNPLFPETITAIRARIFRVRDYCFGPFERWRLRFVERHPRASKVIYWLLAPLLWFYRVFLAPSKPPAPPIPPLSVAARDHHFRIMAWQDVALALCVMGVLTKIGLLPLVLLPVLPLAYALLTAGRLDPAIVAQIRAQSVVPKRVYFLRTHKDDCYALSIPFITFVFLSDAIIADPARPEHKATVDHELGHAHNNDWLLVNFYIVSSLAFIGAFLVLLARHGQGGAGWTLAALDDANNLWPLLLFAIAVLNLLALYGVLHRREYIADHNAAKHAREGLLALLEKQARRERYRKSKTLFTRIANALTHPDAASRLRAQTTRIAALEANNFRYALRWSLSCLLMIAAFADRNFTITAEAGNIVQGVLRDNWLFLPTACAYPVAMGIVIARTKDFYATNQPVGEQPHVLRGHVLAFALFALFVQQYRDGLSFGDDLVRNNAWSVLVFLTLAVWLFSLNMAHAPHGWFRIRNRAAGLISSLILAGVFVVVGTGWVKFMGGTGFIADETTPADRRVTNFLTVGVIGVFVGVILPAAILSLTLSAIWAGVRRYFINSETTSSSASTSKS